MNENKKLSPYHRKQKLVRSEKRCRRYIDKVLKYEGYTLLPYKIVVVHNDDRHYLSYNSHGRCYKNSGKIYIMDFYLDAEREHLDSIVAHEILHMVKQASGHNRIWTSLARSVSEIAPFKIEHYVSQEVLKCKAYTDLYKYQVRCNVCNDVVIKARKRTRRIQEVEVNGYKHKCCKCNAEEGFTLHVK